MAPGTLLIDITHLPAHSGTSVSQHVWHSVPHCIQKDLSFFSINWPPHTMQKPVQSFPAFSAARASVEVGEGMGNEYQNQHAQPYHSAHKRGSGGNILRCLNGIMVVICLFHAVIVEGIR